VGKSVGTTHAGRGGSARQGRTGGDAPRRRRDNGLVGSSQDGGVPVERWLWRFPVASRGGSCDKRRRGEGGLPVAQSERKRSGGTGKASEDGGGTIFKGSGGETAEGV
jgi:hypothetical protein